MNMFKLQPAARSPVTRGTVIEESSERTVKDRRSGRSYGQEISEILVTNLSGIREVCNCWNNESRNSNLHRTRGYVLLIRAKNWCVNAFQWLNKISKCEPCTPKCTRTMKSLRTSYCDPTISLFVPELKGHLRESNIRLTILFHATDIYRLGYRSTRRLLTYLEIQELIALSLAWHSVNRSNFITTYYNPGKRVCWATISDTKLCHQRRSDDGGNDVLAKWFGQLNF
jgi:hypothetical protein